MTTISSDVIRGYNDTMILYLLWDEPSYGYEISKPLLTATIPTLANAAPIIASQMPVEPTIMRNVPNGN